MEKDIWNHFNPDQYEQHLSPFGKKVLQILVRRSQTRYDQNRTENIRKQSYQNHNKRVITFNNSHAITTSTQQEQMAIENENNLEFFENNLSEVPRSVEIIKAVHTDNLGLGNDHVVCPVISTKPDLINDNTILNYEEPSDYNADKVKNMNQANNVDWDDMFDAALLPDATDNVNLDIKTYLRNENPIEKPTRHNYESNNSNVEKPKTKNSKRKKQTKIIDGIPKKVKKINKHEKLSEANNNNITDERKESVPTKILRAPENKTTKNSFRKQKYTKTVKNWLNNVTPNNPVQEDIIDIENISNTKDHSELDKQDEDGTTTSKPKKVIQSQLANKDGVMKYSKPKQQTETNRQVHENKLEKDVIKGKRAKFIAPDKSQIPVKDIVFNVSIVAASDLDEYKLLDLKDNDLFVTIIYSNGFSQLNSHHTEDTCVPDGILLNNDDIFYYFRASNPRIIEIVIHLFENNKILCYDGKSILNYLATQYDIEINSSRIFDTQIGCFLLDPDNPPENFTALQKVLGSSPQYTVATECRLQKAAWYLTLLRDSWTKLRHQLVQDSLWSVFANIETPLIPIVASMERHGVKVDVEKLRSMERRVGGLAAGAQRACHAAAGRPFRVGSAAQVRALLYDELRLHERCQLSVTETITKGEMSTSETMLRVLAARAQHPLPGLVLQYRRLHKAHATFLAGIAQHLTHDGLVKPTWVQTAAATGRMACNNPNLQAIPKAPFSLTLSPGPEDQDADELSFRSIFVSRAGRVLVAADFRHVECRVFARAAADDTLLQLLRTHRDLFTALAGKWLKKAEEAVSGAERERTKRVVYASLYGAGARKLADILHLGYDQALDILTSFNRTFPSLKSFGAGVVSACARAGGRVSTPSGRARRLPHVTSSDTTRRAQAERQAVNFIVQGTAADVCKSAMAAAVCALRGAPPAARLLLQLHDELLWEVDEHRLHATAAVIKRAMEGCGDAHAPLPVALAAGRCWGEMAPLTLT